MSVQKRRIGKYLKYGIFANYSDFYARKDITDANGE